MTEKSAKQSGLVFTGSYGWDKEEQKSKASEIRALGYRAVVVDITPSPYSRGHHGMGYSVYVEPKFTADNEAKRKQQLVAGHAARLAAIRAEHEAKLAAAMDEENKRNDANVNWLTENNYPLA